MNWPKCERCGQHYRLVPMGYSWSWEPTCWCPNHSARTILTTYSTTTSGADPR